MTKLENILNENHQVVTLEMKNLRDAFGSERLGKKVLTGIARELAEAGLATYPEHLPADAKALVRVYRRDSVAGVIIRAVGDMSPRGDKVLDKLRRTSEVTEQQAAPPALAMIKREANHHEEEGSAVREKPEIKPQVKAKSRSAAKRKAS